MIIDSALLDLLVCPETREKLHLAEDALLAKVNEAVRAGTLRDRAGRAVERPIEGGLVRPDGRLLYPIIDSIPDLLLDDAIPLEQFER